MNKKFESDNRVSRRSFVTITSAAMIGGMSSNKNASAYDIAGDKVPPESYKIKNGRIKQSVYHWCYEPMPIMTLIEAAHKMGLHAMDINAKYYPELKKRGMKLSMVGSHGFKTGPFSKENHAFCLEKLKNAIDTASQCDCRNVITFTGMREKGITDEQGAKNCVECWKKACDYAEKKNITLCLEILNTRDDSHPMKGHPGYFGDDVDLCIDLIKKVDSPSMKLLFDIYHTQVMNGDVIRRIRQYQDYIGHYHTAGAPGRAEIDDTQELYYPAIMRAILETGYTGFVTQEFIPEWDDKLAALRHAVSVCDV